MTTFQRRPVRHHTFATRQQIRIMGAPAQPFEIAYGHSFSAPPAETMVESRSGIVRRIFAIGYEPGQIAQLWPPYCEEIVHRGDSYMIAAATSAAEIAAARRFLERHHGDRASPQGMLISLYAMLGEEGGARRLIGVAQIGEYYHTHFPGRAQFGQPLLGNGYARLGRGEVIKRTRLAAGKRFAVATKWRGQQLGDLLAAHALVIARDYRWPPAQFVEVSRYQGAAKYLEICCKRGSDFLTRSGYVPVPPRKWLRKGAIDARIAVELGPRGVPGYYYADLTTSRRARSVRRALPYAE